MRLLPASAPPIPVAPPRRRRALWITGGLAVAMFAVLTALDMRLEDTGGPGIVSFELAFTDDRAREILGEWGSDGRDTALLSLLLDYVFIVGWALFLSLLCLVVAARQWRERMASLGERIAWVPLVSGLFDMLEDAALLGVLAADGDQPWPLVAGVFASAKFALLGVTVVWLVVGLVAARGKPGPPPP